MGTEIWCFIGLIATLLAVVVYQQVFFTRQIQTLVDKLMCRSFNEYQTAKNPPPPRIKIEDGGPAEDLRSLHELQVI